MKLYHAFKGIAAFALLSLSSLSYAGNDTETDENGVILAGHDVIAYFKQNKPVLGNAKYTAVYNDAIYRFQSAKNRDMFNSNPEKYAPQYGGFCAYGVTFGKKFDIDGKAFEIKDGKLYVNKNMDVYKAWAENIPKHIKEANDHWPDVENVSADDL